MRLRVFRGPDLAAAMTAVRRAFGEDGLILETREAECGIEIVAASAAGPSGTPAPLVIPPPRDSDGSILRESLASHGISADLVQKLLEPDLVQGLASSIRFGKLPLRLGDAPLFFAGEPGAGKTLSVIKVATRLVLRGESPLVISTDGNKAGAIEQLAAMTQLLGLTLVVAREPGQLRRAVARRIGGAPVLIDGAGLDIFSDGDRASLAALSKAASAEILLTLPAGLDVGHACEIAAAYAALGASHLLPTRLDISRRLGGIIEPAVRSGLVLTEAGNAPGAVDGLVPLDPLMLAERLRTPAGRRDRLPAPISGDPLASSEQEWSTDGSTTRHAVAAGTG